MPKTKNSKDQKMPNTKNAQNQQCPKTKVPKKEPKTKIGQN